MSRIEDAVRRKRTHTGCVVPACLGDRGIIDAAAASVRHVFDTFGTKLPNETRASCKMFAFRDTVMANAIRNRGFCVLHPDVSDFPQISPIANLSPSTESINSRCNETALLSVVPVLGTMFPSAFYSARGRHIHKRR